MKAAHTPGPWVVASDSDRDNDDCYGIFSKDGLDAALFDSDFIAKTNLDHKNHEENARLIAAAPELLEVAKLFAAYEDAMNRDDHIVGMCLYNEASKKVRSAIAKAERRDL